MSGVFLTTRHLTGTCQTRDPAEKESRATQRKGNKSDVSTSGTSLIEEKRKRGRPKGSKNKPNTTTADNAAIGG